VLSATWSHAAWLHRATAENSVVAAVARFYDVKIRDMQRPVRHRIVARARMIAMFLLRNCSNLSFPEIGRIVGRDHSTVIHGVNQVTRVWATDERMQKDIAELCRRIGASPPTLPNATTFEAVGF